MGTTLSPIFQTWLTANRDYLNMQYEMLKNQYPALEQKVVFSYIQQNLNVVATALLEENNAPESHQSIKTLYTTGLNLMGRGLWSKFPVLIHIWQEVFPKLPLLRTHLHRTLQIVVNTAYNVSQSNRSTGLFLIGLRRTAPQLDQPHKLEAAALILAWRSGLVLYRTTAIKAAEQLPESLARILLEVPEAHTLSFILENLQKSLWFRSETGQHDENTQIGGFQGFGGAFLNPPEIALLNQQTLLAKDTTGTWEIHADCYGHALVRHEGVWPGTNKLVEPGILMVGNKRLRIRSFPQAEAAALTPTIWAITVPNSHYIHLMRPPF
ncbi:MAG: hypothetical protein JNN12_04600 [Bacteroidetes Order II. Incertae sedis bacterium]|nr:hypothetical protein [Bacteroidetes Order II. bacterium]